MKPKHEGFTPGPWRVSPESNGTFVRGVSGGLVASMEAGSQIKRDPDARLIADAPALLAENEWLRALLERVLDVTPLDGGLSCEIRAAIAATNRP